LVPSWRDAKHHGWAVPSDGHLQLCPDCLKAHKDGLTASAVPAGSLAAPDYALGRYRRAEAALSAAALEMSVATRRLEDAVLGEIARMNAGVTP
jgi:hypothetical protein